MTHSKILVGLLFLFSFFLIMFGEIANTNCKKIIPPGEDVDLFSYLINLVGSILNPCSDIPNWVTILIFVPIGLGIAYIALTLIPWVGK